MVEQAFNGLVSGAFYALLALGLAVIFGMLGVVNFAHGAFYMLGAFGAFVLLDSFGIGFWAALLIVPVLLGLAGVVLERLFIRRLAALDPLYNFLLTFGLALILQDVVRSRYGVQSQQYGRPGLLDGSLNLGLFEYPAYQVFVLALSALVCGLVWLALTRTKVGMIVRASTEKPELTRALGIDVARWVTPVFGFGIALAGLAGVLAAPMRAINPLMGADLIIVVFAVVVIGGLGSVFGSVAAGFLIGLISALGNLYVPALSQTLVFILMAAVLLWRPAGLFGREEGLV
ncbi:amino acid/amide ABC transporter membrane protein 1, HAAT family [Thermomonospora echinospora]|uniref:Amino acid/amide ABC transporter membrane protein 1, HAAT family n=1 Tax=Thermomonospora echinospora TaxID=1992 RepID=A0A1H6CMJ5_9ACTN|nr:branched-chain amino acid ABC transporter permease [Thermomonospora echinospora]SEG74192.1 amino acid/amide ABC transporter membrane protein 1, HAAT family [Thermomonospora echinospora]